MSREPGEFHTSCWVTPGNPCAFNSNTTIECTLPTASRVDLAIYDLGGHLVRTLVRDRGFSAGPGSLEWDGRDDKGACVPTGVYLYRLVAGGTTATGRMALIR